MERLVVLLPCKKVGNAGGKSMVLGSMGQIGWEQIDSVIALVAQEAVFGTVCVC